MQLENIKLTEEEADVMSAAGAKAAAHFDWLASIDSKWSDVLAFAVICGSIEGAKFELLKAKMARPMPRPTMRPVIVPMGGENVAAQPARPGAPPPTPPGQGVHIPGVGQALDVARM